MIRKNMGLAKEGEDGSDGQDDSEEEEPNQKKKVTIADDKKAPKSALKKSGEVERSSSRPKSSTKPMFGVDREGYKHHEVKHTDKCGDCRYLKHESALACKGECITWKDHHKAKKPMDCFECQS